MDNFLKIQLRITEIQTNKAGKQSPDTYSSVLAFLINYSRSVSSACSEKVKRNYFFYDILDTGPLMGKQVFYKQYF